MNGRFEKGSMQGKTKNSYGNGSRKMLNNRARPAGGAKPSGSARPEDRTRSKSSARPENSVRAEKGARPGSRAGYENAGGQGKLEKEEKFRESGGSAKA